MTSTAPPTIAGMATVRQRAGAVTESGRRSGNECHTVRTERGALTAKE